MACSKEKPLDNPTFEACQEALVAALATVQQWRPGGEVDPHLKAKLALLIIKHAAKGETSPAILRKRALWRITSSNPRARKADLLATVCSEFVRVELQGGLNEISPEDAILRALAVVPFSTRRGLH